MNYPVVVSTCESLPPDESSVVVSTCELPPPLPDEEPEPELDEPRPDEPELLEDESLLDEDFLSTVVSTFDLLLSSDEESSFEESS